MKVSIELSPEYSEPYAIIYADKITDSIQRTLDIFGSNESPITAFQNENDIVILQPKEIYMVRVENKDTIIYGKEHRYRSRKRLYEMQQQLGAGFMQISKSTLVNWYSINRFLRYRNGI
ncbi:LytTR family transcriptional regulator DNA-binding domain-containing protein [Agathobacter sp. LCP21S3_B2]|uniref:LytTR family DNA-binding domain-containing protein n=1 Tax=Agathobacter sp. LCP21S3_B2 TaxID=3438734 RepID=UPI003F8FB6B2